METLEEMLARFAAEGSNLTTDLSHWADMGVTTAEQLGDYLDACVAREEEKAMLYADEDRYCPEADEALEPESDDEEFDSDSYDGQPDEMQEWHDFDPDC